MVPIYLEFLVKKKRKDLDKKLFDQMTLKNFTQYITNKPRERFISVK